MLEDVLEGVFQRRVDLHAVSGRRIGSRGGGGGEKNPLFALCCETCSEEVEGVGERGGKPASCGAGEEALRALGDAPG